jgi:hypothetical protein
MPSSRWRRRRSLRSLAASCAPGARAGGRPSAGPQTVRGQLAEPLWLLEVVGCAALAGPGTQVGALAEPGRALALEALHARATGPRPNRRGLWPLRPAVAIATPARLPHRNAAS